MLRRIAGGAEAVVRRSPEDCEAWAWFINCQAHSLGSAGIPSLHLGWALPFAPYAAWMAVPRRANLPHRRAAFLISIEQGGFTHARS